MSEEEVQYPLPAGVTPKVIQERIAKRNPNPDWQLSQKEQVLKRFRPPKAEPRPKWVDDDYQANNQGHRQLIVLDDGTEYIGGWKLNLRHGHGQHFTAKGMCDGDFVDDLYQGHGAYFIWSDVSNLERIEGRYLLYKGNWFE